MESYYLQHFNPSIINAHHVSLKNRATGIERYPGLDSSIQVPSSNKFNFLVDLFSSADIVQFQGSFDPLVCEAAAIAKVPLLVEVLHNIEPGGLFKNINLSVCVSEAVQRAQKRDRVMAGLCPVIHNGIDLNEFRFQSKDISKQEKSSSPLIILQVGAREKIKVHLDELAPYIREQIPNAEFWIAGRGQDLPSTDIVTFLGVQNNIATLYQQADLMFLLSGDEPFGLACIEAMASGAIPIVSAKGAFPELVSDNISGFLIDDSPSKPVPEQIIEAIKTYSSTNSKEMRIAGRKFVEENFEISHCIKKYEDLYTSSFEKIASSSNITRNRLIITRPNVPGNALVGEAIFAFHENDFARVYTTLRSILKEFSTITNAACIHTLADLALFSVANGERELGTTLFKYLFSSHEEKEYVFQAWLKAEDTSSILKDGSTPIIQWIIDNYSCDADLILGIAEILVRENKTLDAIELLITANNKISDLSSNDELSGIADIYLNWIQKIREVCPEN